MKNFKKAGDKTKKDRYTHPAEVSICFVERSAFIAKALQPSEFVPKVLQPAGVAGSRFYSKAGILQ